jgi:NADP-dependent 3-hydroxy acid dehydrogenase YdfG
MTKKVLVLGGTKGLGLSLALEAIKLQLSPCIVGRDFSAIQHLPQLTKANFLFGDILDRNNPITINKNFDYFIWSAGVFLKKQLHETTDIEIDAMIDLHFRQPIRLLRDYICSTKKSFHLIVIASCSGWKLRECESIYTGIKAAQAAFTRNLVPELIEKFRDIKVTLINPGGLNTPNFHKNNAHIMQEGSFLNPDIVAKIIWEKVLTQCGYFSEWQILRNKKNPEASDPIILAGPQLPEVPQ